MSLASIGSPVVTIAVDVSFLRMDRAPVAAGPMLPAHVRVERLTQCSVAFYRFLYNTVGFEYVWWLRRTLHAAELQALLRDPGVSIHVLYADGEPAGFYELDRRGGAALNLSYFGLMPHVVGHGLGQRLLRHAVDTAWAEQPPGLTVNTCTADHRRALPNYLGAGFDLQRTVREVWRVPVRLGMPIPDRLRL